ncbi:MAG TPA: hypothetical protein VK662_00305 [Acidothermaceae bacterium]|nr:hypothetical protein [Acidothermaceae bacterium]
MAFKRQGADDSVDDSIGYFVLAGALVAFGFSVLNSPAGKSLRQCLNNANGNKTAISQCDSQYASNH